MVGEEKFFQNFSSKESWAELLLRKNWDLRFKFFRIKLACLLGIEFDSNFSESSCHYLRKMRLKIIHFSEISKSNLSYGENDPLIT